MCFQMIKMCACIVEWHTRKMEENREYYNEKRRNCFIHTPTKEKNEESEKRKETFEIKI